MIFLLSFPLVNSILFCYSETWSSWCFCMCVSAFYENLALSTSLYIMFYCYLLHHLHDIVKDYHQAKNNAYTLRIARNKKGQRKMRHPNNIDIAKRQREKRKKERQNEYDSPYMYICHKIASSLFVSPDRYVSFSSVSLPWLSISRELNCLYCMNSTSTVL